MGRNQKQFNNLSAGWEEDFKWARWGKFPVVVVWEVLVDDEEATCYLQHSSGDFVD